MLVSCETARLQVTDLFLTDAPLENFGHQPHKGHDRTVLSTKYSNNTGGLQLPGLLLQQPHCLYDIFRDFLRHRWHFDYLFGVPGAIRPHSLLYLLVANTWQTNIGIVARQLKRASFRDIRRPTEETNEQFHDAREELVLLKERVRLTIKFVPVGVEEYFTSPSTRKDIHRAARHVSGFTPMRGLREVHEQAIELEPFLMNTFTLLLSSINLQDSKLSIEQAELANDQARRATLITVLAFVYVPLTFVTGIFGMNIRHLDSLTWWWTLVALAVVGAFTGILYLLAKHGGINSNECDANEAEPMTRET